VPRPARPPAAGRAQLRAVLLAVAFFWYGLAALPSPKKISRGQFEHPVAVEELDRWVDILAGLGLKLERAELIDHLVGTGGAVVSARSRLLAPAQSVFRLTGTGQGWGFFAYPDSYPDRLIVEGRRDSEPWTLLYRALDSTHAFLSKQLTNRRIRGVYDGHSDRPGKPYDNFAGWVASEAFEADPSLHQVRVRFERTHTLPPTHQPDLETTSRLERVIDRDGGR
jgi:hypothetical protein